MNAPFKVLCFSSLYPILALYRFKKDIPKHAHGSPVALDFGLWGCWYGVKVGNNLSLKAGGTIPVHFAHLTTGPCVGPRDLEAGKNTKHAEAWRESYAATIAERLQLHGMNR